MTVNEMCDTVKTLGKAGATINMMALDLGISLTDISALRRQHPEFDQAVTTALNWSLGWHERRLMENADNKAFSSQTATALLRAAFPDTYESATYKKDVAKTNTDASNIDYNAEVRELIRQLQEAGS